MTWRPSILFFLAVNFTSTAFSQTSSPLTPLTLQEAITRATATSPIVKAAQLEVEQNALLARVRGSLFLPEVDLKTGYQLRKSEDEEHKGSYAFAVGRINLYNGGRDQNTKQIAVQEVEYSEAQLKLTKVRIAQAVAREFFELLYLQEALRLKEEAREENRSQKKIAERVAQAGFTSSADVLEFDFRESALLTEIELLKHERNVASRNLSIALGEEPRTGLQITGDFDRDFEALKASTSSVLVAPQEALLKAKTAVQIAELEHRSSLATWLPRLDLESQYGNLRFADPEVEGTPAWSVGVSLTFPLFSGMETLYSRQNTALAMARREAELKQTQLDSRGQQQDNEEKLKVLANLLILQKTNIEKAERSYRATMNEYRRGVKNAPDVTEATARLFSTRDRDFQLKRDQILAYLGLYRDPSVRGD